MPTASFPELPVILLCVELPVLTSECIKNDCLTESEEMSHGET